jgi:exosortase
MPSSSSTTPVAVPESESRNWAGPLQGALLVVLLGLLYYRIVTSLVMQWWHDPNYSHGFFVPLFCAWVLWKQRKHLANVPLKPSWQGLLVIQGGLCILVLGVLGAENFLSRTSLLFVLGGLTIYFCGWTFFRALLFPWAGLFLMIPLPVILFNEAALPLQFQASRLASGLLTLVGVPVLREGNVIHLPALTLDVVEACSGLRSLVSLITLAVIYGYVFERRASRRLLLIVSVVPIAVIANSFRIMGSGILGEYWSPETAEGFFHVFSGLLIFLVSLGMLLLFHAAVSLFDRRSLARQA